MFWFAQLRTALKIIRRGGCPVAEERHADLLRTAHHATQRGPRGHVETGSHDSVHAHDALGHVGDVHGAAVAFVVAGLLKEDLGGHLVQVAALGDQVTVAAMGAGDVVVLVQRADDADGHRLLADIGVEGTVEPVLAGEEQVFQRRFPFSAGAH